MDCFPSEMDGQTLNPLPEILRHAKPSVAVPAAGLAMDGPADDDIDSSRARDYRAFGATLMGARQEDRQNGQSISQRKESDAGFEVCDVPVG
jgi:hypothetical protein